MSILNKRAQHSNWPIGYTPLFVVDTALNLVNIALCREHKGWNEREKEKIKGENIQVDKKRKRRNIRLCPFRVEELE